MINQIKYKKSLKDFISNECEENKYFVKMADDIPKDHYLVIKVDNYYNSLNLKKTPPSIDCLVPLKCRNNDYVIYLVELRNVKSSGGFGTKSIYNKFKTTVENFMGSRFRNIFYNERYSIRSLQLYFITAAYGKTGEKWRKEGTKVDMLRSMKPFKFQGKRYQLKHILPNPLIDKC